MGNANLATTIVITQALEGAMINSCSSYSCNIGGNAMLNDNSGHFQKESMVLIDWNNKSNLLQTHIVWITAVKCQGSNNGRGCSVDLIEACIYQ